MTRVTIFTSTIGDGPRLTVSVTRDFESPDPFTVMLGSDAWPLSTHDAERLSAAGRRIEGTLDYLRPTQRTGERGALLPSSVGQR